MNKSRLEAFSDGVLAIIITIMVLEFKVPHGVELVDLKPLLPKFLSYILSFIYLGIYWNNHHHMMHTVRPLLMAAIAYYTLQTIIIKTHRPDSLLARAIGKDIKGKISPILYVLAIGSCWISQWIAAFLYVLFTLIWLIPDKRIEVIFKDQKIDKQ